jgi:hypothetical protein
MEQLSASIEVLERLQQQTAEALRRAPAPMEQIGASTRPDQDTI